MPVECGQECQACGCIYECGNCEACECTGIKLVTAQRDALLEVTKGLVAIRDCQRNRENESFHISAETFMALWDKANDAAVAEIEKVTGEPYRDD